jgi:hypothetical protein
MVYGQPLKVLIRKYTFGARTANMSIRDTFGRARWCASHPGGCARVATDIAHEKINRSNPAMGEAITKARAGTARFRETIRNERLRVEGTVHGAVRQVSPDAANRMQLHSLERGARTSPKLAQRRAWASYRQPDLQGRPGRPPRPPRRSRRRSRRGPPPPRSRSPSPPHPSHHGPRSHGR